jgi:hypothetical protein
MEVNKLIITPIFRDSKGVVMKNVDSEKAQQFILERMESSVDIYENTKVPRKLPAWLKNFLNPQKEQKNSKFVKIC